MHPEIAPNIQPNNVPKLKAVYKGRKKERKQEKISSKKNKKQYKAGATGIEVVYSIPVWRDPLRIITRPLQPFLKK